MIRSRVRFATAATLFSAAAASAQTADWVRQFGVSIEDATSATAADPSGGLFATGYTYGSMFEPSEGEADVWVARYDAAGSETWAHQFGTAAIEVPFAMARDTTGGVFLAGSTGGDLGGPSAGGRRDAWIARYDDSGARSWVAQLGSTADEWAQALAPDGAGGAFVAGWTDGDLGGASAGAQDAWLARYDGSGARLWILQFGTPEEDWGLGLASDGRGGVYVAGYTLGALGGPSAGGEDVWLARYDGTGARSWIVQIGTGADDTGAALAADGAGGVFVAGSTFGHLGGPSAGDSDVWLARYDAGGAQTWITQFGTDAEDRLFTLGPSGAGGLYIAGDTQGELGGPWAGRRDVWVARHGASGSRTWIHQFGSDAMDYVTSLAPGAGGVFAGGLTTGDLAGPRTGFVDAWLARFHDSTTCYADCDSSGSLDFFDFLCFQNEFAATTPYADCDESGAHDFFDFLCFQNAFAAGCP